MARSGGFVAFDAHWINLFCMIERMLLQPTLWNSYLFISSSLFCEAVCQSVGQGKGLLVEEPYQKHDLISAEVLGRLLTRAKIRVRCKIRGFCIANSRFKNKGEQLVCTKLGNVAVPLLWSLLYIIIRTDALMMYFTDGLFMTTYIRRMKHLGSPHKYLPSTRILLVFISRFDCAQDGGQAFLWAMSALKLSFSTQRPKIAP